ncbi:bidirectional sugar transporter SWEET13-like [Dendrobium catenatum]|uniref:bidirectional sugar transporter SWEET13-like n=1 Tax=Dendrobium catenatum TaxID=906689 RepID=UPI00109F49E3|nr:bidirectional sugar transporter SWEET13-like [Dendrobium catenatum]
MAWLSVDHSWVITFGILGNVISFMVFLSPLPTFYRILQKKSTEEFKSEPYIIALFSAMLWLFYAFIKTNELLLIIINSIGCVIEISYITIFLIFAARKARIYAAKLILILIVGVFSIIVLITLLLFRGSSRLQVLGWICVAFAVSVFVAPLSIMKRVIQTKSVEFMPFNLSLFLTLSGISWLFYGLLSKDIYVMLPNILGVSFGFAQLLLYVIYRGKEEVRRVDKVGPEVDTNVNVEECISDKKQDNYSSELRVEQIV